MDPLTWAEALKVYQEYGVGALFLVMYVVTIFAFVRSLTQGRDKEIMRCERLAMLAESMTAASIAQTNILTQLRDSIEADRRETEQLHAYLKARDARGRHP